MSDKNQEKIKNNFYFGSDKKSITPTDYSFRSLSGYGRMERCKGIHDIIQVRVNLFVKVPENLKVENLSNEKIIENTILVLINYDLTGFGSKNLAELRRKINDEIGIKKEVIHVYSTHSHYSPDTEGMMPAPVFPELIFRTEDQPYIQLVMKQTIKAINEAFKKLTHVKIGYGKIQFPKRFVRNRRSPPGYYQILHPFINLIRFDDYSGNIIGLITIFPSHPVIIPSTLNEISGGWPLYYVTMIKKFLEQQNKDKLDITPLLFQGPSGNVSGHYPLKFVSKNNTPEEIHKYHYLKSQKFAECIAKFSTKKILEIKTEPINKVIIKSKNIIIPMAPIYKTLDLQGWKNILYATIKIWLLIPILTLFRRGNIRFMNVARKRTKKNPIPRLHLQTSVTTFAINDIIIAGNPGEPFYNVEKQIKERTGCKNVVVAELCNDCIGYNWTDVERVYKPDSYDHQMSYSNLTGILVRNTAIQEVKEILKDE